ncbi:MAG: hypothetical protein KatS3mg104_0383 [Phycisphaerae bacterium]|nr:MAG: hypothetical protein KatS3mg104_0383 [Phycisphaerae bacterium]
MVLSSGRWGVKTFLRIRLVRPIALTTLCQSRWKMLLKPHYLCPPPVDVPPEIANDDGHGGSDESSESVSGDPTESTDQSDLTGDVRKLLIEHPQASSKSLLVSVLLVPLKLVNAPFTGLSDQTRDVLGQIGLITLVNALAILVYVLIFR